MHRLDTDQTVGDKNGIGSPEIVQRDRTCRNGTFLQVVQAKDKLAHNSWQQIALSQRGADLAALDGEHIRRRGFQNLALV